MRIINKVPTGPAGKTPSQRLQGVGQCHKAHGEGYEDRVKVGEWGA